MTQWPPIKNVIAPCKFSILNLLPTKKLNYEWKINVVWFAKIFPFCNGILFLGFSSQKIIRYSNSPLPVVFAQNSRKALWRETFCSDVLNIDGWINVIERLMELLRMLWNKINRNKLSNFRKHVFLKTFFEWFKKILH